MYANDRNWSTILLMVSFNSRNSPRTSTVIFFARSPFATAVVTVAMFSHLRSEIRRHEIHILSQILPGTSDSFDFCLAAEFAFRADFARNARDL